MSPASLQKLSTSYKKVAVEVPSPSPFPSEGAEHKATQRARKAQPESPRKRQRVLNNLMADAESQLFVQNFGTGVAPQELAALRLLAANLKEINDALNEDHGAVRSNQVRHLKKVIRAVVASQATKDQRLLRETARLTGCERHALSFGISFRERPIKRDVNALFAVEVILIKPLVLKMLCRDIPLLLTL
jgi:hypothetical protein